ncbi:MAG: Thiol:disulfide interchange protein DsbC [Syntrophomonadaceae bacterium]|nr:Thiol:disulfide interchange protein DsbC [Bacillota bacterium]
MVNIKISSLAIIISSALALSACAPQQDVGVSDTPEVASDGSNSKTNTPLIIPEVIPGVPVGMENSDPQALLDSMATAPARDRIGALLAKVAPDLKIVSIEASPMKGIYQVLTEDIQLFYVSEDGTKLINGSMFDVITKQPVTENFKVDLRAERLKEFNREYLITYPAKGKPKGEVYVFTDISCSFCVKAHEEITEITAKGITVNYIPFPRNGAGADNPVADKKRQIWCSGNMRDALDKAKKGQPLTARTDCERAAAIQAGFDFGRSMQVNSTPSIFTSDGVQIGGFLEAEDLVQRVELVRDQAAARKN